MFLLQDVNTREVREIIKHCMLTDSPYRRSNIVKVGEHPDCVPVGSVEFVEAYMNAHDILLPKFTCYPAYVKHNRFYGRHIQVGVKQNVCDGIFVKPLKTKLFTGFVYPDTDEENFAEFSALPDDTDCFFSETIDFVSEFRYYVSDSRIVGWARYDQGEEENIPVPDAKFVFSAIETLCPPTCAIDIGVTSGGESLVIELNDLWALGIYGNNLSASAYANLLEKRWKEIHGETIRTGLSLLGNS